MLDTVRPLEAVLRRAPHRTSIALFLVTVAIALSAPAAPAHAFEPFAFLIPCRATATNAVGTVRPCITCHNNADGGSGCAMPPCFNAFGMAFNGNGRVWNETLATMDSDGDGYTNGEELRDPLGTWRPAMGTPSDAICGCATRPGFETFTPGDTDADGDGYCCRGQDTDMNGDCRGSGEHDSSFDCNEMNDMVNSGMAELCTNTVDNDCDGLPTLMDPDCASVVDRDGDGYCPMGRDTNRDRDCIDSGEVTSDVDCDDTQITVYPGNRENCADGLDNDCNGMVDTGDPMCTSDTDADMDGFCPIGRDLNGNGHCNDPGELDAGIDCDDTNASVNPLQTEICTDGLDNDCNGVADRLDAAVCDAVYDNDGDGYCPTGRDLNGDGDCADSGEAEEASDCDDTEPLVSPGAAETCTNDRDDDCDTLVSLDDPDCAGYLDSDGDRYCFVGFDMDRDGMSLGDEITGDGDCDDTNAELNPHRGRGVHRRARQRLRRRGRLRRPRRLRALPRSRPRRILPRRPRHERRRRLRRRRRAGRSHGGRRRRRRGPARHRSRSDRLPGRAGELPRPQGQRPERRGGRSRRVHARQRRGRRRLLPDRTGPQRGRRLPRHGREPRRHRLQRDGRRHQPGRHGDVPRAGGRRLRRRLGQGRQRLRLPARSRSGRLLRDGRRRQRRRRLRRRERGPLRHGLRRSQPGGEPAGPRDLRRRNRQRLRRADRLRGPAVRVRECRDVRRR
ncbi:MAG: MopE-related protein [Sandaracinaceae bacterium]|nr:MopE-related protein [Sandaracinaceae bacterium]